MRGTPASSLRRHSMLPSILLGMLGNIIVARGDESTFETAVAPILAARCLECHNSTQLAGGLDLSTREGLHKGGKNGAALVAGKADESFLLQRVSDGEMPPKSRGKARPLPAGEVAALRSWIEAGADWPKGRVLDPFERTTASRAGRDWWALRPLVDSPVPDVSHRDQLASPIDAFLLAPLEAKGWNYAPPVGRRALIRRVYFDLVGYPPTHEEIDAFAADPDPSSYERLVERLLASPHYAERWARHWLDVVRYAETCGYERDQEKPHAWKYREWVIRAFQEDMPYDRFVVEQLAGDEVDDRSESSVIATGFLRLGTWNDEPNDPQDYKYERLEDMVHATSTAFLGLTVKCARCHDHKFDPIRQTDYYRMASTFWAGPIEPGPRELLGGPDRKTLGHEVLGWTDLGREPPPFHLLEKGESRKPGPVIQPATLSTLPALEHRLDPPPADARTSRRRLQLARWIIDPLNPLAPRVWVNRLWQYHFGEGLVRSPDNLGFNGEKPTHPELLDWLASRLVEGGWRAKPIHRLILLSSAYRQASIHPDAASLEQSDAGNRLAWRAERRRLDAEALRDALLTAGGQLDRSRIGGPSFRPDIASEALEGLSMKDNAWKASPPAEQRRRGLYVFSKRGLLSPLMTTFDFPDTTLPCGRRDVTLVPPQALALLNNPLVHEQSAALARRVASGAANTPDRIALAWRLALGRDPRASEVEAAAEHLERQRAVFAAGKAGRPDQLALESLCHVLMNSNEFLFID